MDYYDISVFYVLFQIKLHSLSAVEKTRLLTLSWKTNTTADICKFPKAVVECTDMLL